MRRRFFSLPKTIAKLMLIVLSISTFCLTRPNLVIAQDNEDPVQSAVNRLGRYSGDYNFSTEEQDKVADKCGQAQTKLQAVKQRLDQVQRRRNQTYDVVDADLRKFQAAILKQELDTSTIDLMIARYDLNLKNYREALNNYRKMIADMIIIDCTERPDLFLIGLQKSRDLRTEVLTSSVRIKAFTQTELKNVFDQIAGKLDR